LECARTNGIEVYTSQTLPSIAVAELALGLMIDVLRHISQHHAIIKNGEWIKSSGSLIYGKTLGIVGCGRIGKALVSLTKGFEMKYLAFDQEMDIEFGKLHNIRYVDLSYLLNQSDVVSINISKSSDTTDLIGAEELAMMRKDAVFINTARGGIVSEDALVEALRKSEIAGAGIDVFDQEPYVGPLTDLENVVLTPHIGSNAGEIRERMEIDAVNNLIAVLKP